MRQRIRQLRDYLHEKWMNIDANEAARYLFTIGLGIIVAGFIILYLIDPRDEDEFSLRQLLSDLYANGGAELLSIAVTVLIIERLNRRRAEQERKEELILQMGSPNNDFAVEAVRILRQKGWLEDGSLQRAYLSYANLQEAILMGANLQEANLASANLQEANLANANLHGAYLVGAKLQGADLASANLQGANLMGAKLQGADLVRANLQTADLMGTKLQGADLASGNLHRANLTGANLQAAILYQASLQGANLTGANLQDINLIDFLGRYNPPICDENTIFPDGTHWIPDCDWREFTHPNEWAAEQNKATLLLKLRTSYSVSIEAILSILREQGWLLDGTLNHVDLRGVNFYLQDINGANLQGANLQEAYLGEVNLQGAFLREANLQAADLTYANLQGVRFTWYTQPIRDKNTTLPDGSRWTPDRDWREFTHPEEWAAEQAKKRFAFSKPPGFARNENNQASSSKQ